MQVLKVLTRICVSELEPVVSFYEKALGLKASKPDEQPGLGLESAEVGNFLFMAGNDRELRFAKRIFATFVVDSVEEFKNYLEGQGVQIVRAPQPSPCGVNMIVRHPDGLAVEYVEMQK